ncbi:ABC transporter substrate-binding protein [Shewanella sp. JM162201]|uniref:ABC transporter substrate-binding protein n=2 Tax=Shewanella jiangmenensis TaxID=2837387 RepID=A0ABS5V6E5_9GAMM|nr:ABC transporter substrate-binding protein [Shewanella jiangmenensis]
MRFCCFFLIGLLSPLGALADDPGLERESLRFLTEPLPPLSFLELETPTGFAVELVEALKVELGEPGDIEVLPWARAYNIASRESNVLLFSTALRESRRSLFDFVGPIATARIMVYKRNVDSASPQDLQAAAKLGSLGVYRGSPAERLLQQAGVANLEVSSYPLQSLRQLLAGHVRFWCQVDLSVARLLMQAGTAESSLTPLFELDRIELYLAFSGGTPRATVERWHQALARLYEDGRLAALYRKWFLLEPVAAAPHILWRITPEGKSDGI